MCPLAFLSHPWGGFSFWGCVPAPFGKGGYLHFLGFRSRTVRRRVSSFRVPLIYIGFLQHRERICRMTDSDSDEAISATRLSESESGIFRYFSLAKIQPPWPAELVNLGLGKSHCEEGLERNPSLGIIEQPNSWVLQQAFDTY